MDNIVCLEHSIEADVSPSFAWKWRTDVKNWDDPPAEFQLDGPFATGSSGATLFPGQEPLRWCIRDVRPGRSFVIEVPLDKALLSFEWQFDLVSNGLTRITQRIVLSGDHATRYVNHVRDGFGSTLADGMKRIADTMASAERSARNAMFTSAVHRTTRLTGIAPQFLVDDLDRAIAYYCDKLGFELDFTYQSFYAGVKRDGFAIHLKHAPKLAADREHRKQNEHLDAYISVSGIRDLFTELEMRGAQVIKPLEERPWACLDFYVEDPDGYILCFSEQNA